MKKIILAIDVFGGTQELLERMSQALRALTAGRNIPVEPVFVSSPFYQTFIEGGLRPGERFPTSRTQERLNRLNLPGHPRLTVLWEERKALHASVERLLEYAAATQADVIALTAKATLESTSHPLIGSFATRLLLDARIPLFVVGCKSQFSGRFRNILFATDFTHEESLSGLLSLSKEHHSRITLYHKISHFPSLFTPDTEGSASPDFFERSRAVLEERGGEWTEMAHAQGCEFDVVLDDTGGDLAAGIMAEAEKIGTDLIAIVARSGHIASALFGSVTRDVVGEAKSPVWVMHPGRAGQVNANARKAAI